MNPVIRGWSNYFRIAVAKRVFSDLDNFMYYRAKRYTMRRHPAKSGQWRTRKYWGQSVGSRRANWVFMDKTRGASLMKFSWVKIKRHVMVTGDYSPDDRPCKTIGDNDGQKLDQLMYDTVSCFISRTVSVRFVAKLWKTARNYMSIMSFPRNSGGRTLLIICDCCIETVIARSTATKHLLKHVNCLSRGAGQPARPVLKGRGDGDITSLPDQLMIKSGD
jgi:hypothetical protein